MRDVEDDEFYFEIYRTQSYCTTKNNEIPSLSLFSLVLPEYLQRYGVGSKIFEILKREASKENLQIVVYPVMEEAMYNFLRKQNFKQDHLLRFSFYKK